MAWNSGYNVDDVYGRGRMTITHREIADRLKRIETKLDIVLRDYGLDLALKLDQAERERDMWKAQAQAAAGFTPEKQAKLAFLQAQMARPRLWVHDPAAAANVQALNAAKEKADTPKDAGPQYTASLCDCTACSQF